MKSCECTRAKLGALKDRKGNPICLRCERPHTRRAAVQGLPAMVKAGRPVDGRGRDAWCYERATVTNAVDAVDEVVESGGTQNDAERKLRQVLCGPRTPYKTFQKGMQAGLERIEKKLDERDLPAGFTVKQVEPGKDMTNE